MDPESLGTGLIGHLAKVRACAFALLLGTACGCAGPWISVSAIKTPPTGFGNAGGWATHSWLDTPSFNVSVFLWVDTERWRREFASASPGRPPAPQTWKSSTTTEGVMHGPPQARDARRTAARGVSRAAGHLAVPTGPGNRRALQRIGEIVAGRRAITADTDLRLCRLFGLSNGYWLRAQAAHDTEVAARTLAKELAKIKPWDETRNVKRGRPRTGRAA